MLRTTRLTSVGEILFTLLAIQLAVCCVRESVAEDGPLGEKVDQSEALRVWKHLANERLMFPMQMADVAKKIGTQRQLFVDNCLIARAKHVTRQVHRPKRYAGNPLLKPLPGMLWVQHVYQFEESPRFRMWYTTAPGGAGWYEWKPGERIRFATNYAVSEHGMHWKRPDLGLYEIGDRPKKNVVLPYGLMQGLFYEPWEKDPQKRFKALVCVEAKKFENDKLGEFTIPEGYYLHWSPDGIHWKGDLEHMVIPSLPGNYNLPQIGIGDTSRFWWDSIRKKYICDAKFAVRGSDHIHRCRGMMESDDLIHWTRPHLTFVASESRTQIYGHRGFPYEGMYIGLRWLFRMDYHPKEVHASDLALDCSRDGRLWTRVGGRQLFMAINAKRDTWDSDINAAVSLLVVGDEVWIYYFSGPSAQYRDPKKLPRGHWPGLAKLRLDGFASLNGGDQAGTVVTRPLTFAGKTLHVNAEVAEGGELLVGFRTRDGKKAVKGFSVEDCVPLTGDAVDMSVTWKAGADASSLSHSLTRIEFRLRNAKLYSFWIK